MRKKFNRSLYARYDNLAKQYGKDLIESIGLNVREHSHKMKVDLIVSNNQGEDLFYLEVEIKTALSANFKYPTLHIPYRKSKFCGLSLPTLFCLFSEDGQHYMCVWSKFVEKSKVEEVSNYMVRAGERFYIVDIKKHVDTDIKNALRRKWKKHEGNEGPAT